MATPTLSVPIDETATLNAIVARYPQTLPVLRRWGLDTCCGGALALRDAAAQHKLPLAPLLAALEQAAGQPQ